MRFFIFLSVFSYVTALQAQSIVGTWAGSLKLPQGELPLVLQVSEDQGSLKATVDSPKQQAFGIVVNSIGFEEGGLRFAIAQINASYEGKLINADSIAGTFSQGGVQLPLNLKKEAESHVEDQQTKSIGSKSVGDSTDLQKLKALEPLLQQVLSNHYAAGYAVAVVNKDSVIYSQGFGYSDWENKRPMTANTLMPIGSSTKAFTAALLGRLVQQGKISLDVPAANYLPQLKFSNEELAAKVTLRDMMTHRTGLPRYDYSWLLFPTNSRDSLLARVRYMEPTAALREQWQYNNFMYLAQGMVAEKLNGKSWERQIAEQFFAPLRMIRSSTSIDALKKDSDAALGYYVKDDTVIKKMDYYLIRAMGPAGSINSSVNELSSWAMTWLAGGKFEGKAIIPVDHVADAVSSHMVIGAGKPTAEHPDIGFATYGLGWMLNAYRGHYRVEHGGNINGFTASVCFFPYDNLGIVVLCNQNASGLPAAVRNLIADKLLDLPYYAWSKKAANDKQDKEDIKPTDFGRVRETRPSHHLRAYIGEASHPAFGSIRIKLRNDSLFAHFPTDSMYLKHYHYDVFEGKGIDAETGADTTAGGTKFNFRTNDTGQIEGVQIALDPTVKEAPFFKYKPQVLSREELQQYVGEYDLSSVTVKVYVKNGQLVVSVPGQPDYVTEPAGEHSFKPLLLKGFMFMFEADAGGKIVAFYSVQPNGTFKAVKK